MIETLNLLRIEPAKDADADLDPKDESGQQEQPAKDADADLDPKDESGQQEQPAKDADADLDVKDESGQQESIPLTLRKMKVDTPYPAKDADESGQQEQTLKF